MYTQSQLAPLLAAAAAILLNEDSTGCSDDLTVTSLSACEALRKAVAALPKDQSLTIALHTHRHGVGIYPFLLSSGEVLSKEDFAKYLGDEYEPDREEYLDVEPFTENQIVVCGEPSSENGAPVTPKAYEALYIGTPVGRVLFPNGRVAHRDKDDKVEIVIVASVYELEDKSQHELERFLAERATGDADLLDTVEHFVQGVDEAGCLKVMVVGVAALIDPNSGCRDPLCQKCGSELRDDGFCPDDTCAYSDWLQPVPLDDLTSLPQAEIEAKHDTQKRVRATD